MNANIEVMCKGGGRFFNLELRNSGSEAGFHEFLSSKWIHPKWDLQSWCLQ